jgi:hypothetical protein
VAADPSFHLRYVLTRRQRLAAELPPWLPAIAGTAGFVVGVLYLVAAVSAWFLFLLLLPVVVYRGLFAFLVGIVLRPRRPVEVVVEDGRLCVLTDPDRRWLALDGVFQVFRSAEGGTWTVLHLDGAELTIPADAIAGDQLDYLKSFALRAARERKGAGVGL